MTERVLKLCSDGLCPNEGDFTYKALWGRRVVLCKMCHDELQQNAAVDGVDLAPLAIEPLGKTP